MRKSLLLLILFILLPQISFGEGEHRRRASASKRNVYFKAI